MESICPLLSDKVDLRLSVLPVLTEKDEPKTIIRSELFQEMENTILVRQHYWIRKSLFYFLSTPLPRSASCTDDTHKIVFFCPPVLVYELRRLF